jgi:hypothetical protein
MRFYALRIVCQHCASVFVVGGSAANDLTLWRESVVECQRCGAKTAAAGGEAVSLASRDSSVVRPARELCPA